MQTNIIKTRSLNNKQMQFKTIRNTLEIGHLWNRFVSTDAGMDEINFYFCRFIIGVATSPD